MWQAEHIRTTLAQQLEGRPVTILGMTTVGDQRLDRPLSEIGGKGLFTKELEVALLEGRAHLAVHSLKDVPMQLAPEFSLAAVTQREDPRDAFVSPRFESLQQLPAGAKVGTSSLRRAAQLRSRYPRLEILPLRGNLDTRLAKLDRGEYDAIILAAAGLKRLGLEGRIRALISTDDMIPSPGQGALGIEIMARDSTTAQIVTRLIDEPTMAATTAERAVSLGLGGNCKLPLAAHCVPDGAGLRCTALVASQDGRQVLRAEHFSTSNDLVAARQLGERLAQTLIQRGALQVLSQ